MFVYSVRASTIKFFAVLVLSIIGMLLLLSLGSDATVYASVDGIDVNYGGIKTDADRVAFLESQGLKVKSEPLTEENYTMPDDFDRVISGYNEIQKAQGLDLAKYKGRRITHYAYEVTNYDYDGVVVANMLIYRGRIIALDLSSTDNGGFVCAIVGLDKSKLKSD